MQHLMLLNCNNYVKSHVYSYADMCNLRGNFTANTHLCLIWNECLLRNAIDPAFNTTNFFKRNYWKILGLECCKRKKTDYVIVEERINFVIRFYNDNELKK